MTLVLLARLAISTALPQRASAATPCPAGPGDTATTSVSVATTATYTIWSRIQIPDSSHTGYYIEVDGDCVGAIGGLSTLTPNTWTWVDYLNGSTSTKASRSLSAGSHSVKMIGKDLGVKVDRVIFIADSCIPTGVGDNCMLSSSPTPTSTPTPTRTPTPSPTSTLTPTLTSTPVPTPPPTNNTVSITNLTHRLKYDWLKGRYYIYLNWINSGAPAANFLVFAHDNKSNPLNSFVGSTGGNMTSFRYYGSRQVGLQNNTTYSFSVIGINQHGNATQPVTTNATIRCYWWYCSVK